MGTLAEAFAAILAVVGMVLLWVVLTVISVGVPVVIIVLILRAMGVL